MFQARVAQLVEDNREKLGLRIVSGLGKALLQRDPTESAAMVGHLNLIHPNRIQVIGPYEQRHLDTLDDPALDDLTAQVFASAPAALLFADGAGEHPRLAAIAREQAISIIATAQPASTVIDALRRYLAKTLADSTSRHGVFMDVLGLGVLITGDSGVGKSELGLELISRGHGLVADDVVEISRIGNQLEGRCPALLKDFLEVRGLGVLNIRTIFGETAIRPKMNLRLVVHLERPARAGIMPIERLPLHELAEDLLGRSVAKVVIPVAAGRNLAVLLEAAVRNYILKLRGYDSTGEFVARQQQALASAPPDAGVNPAESSPLKSV